MNVKIGTEAPIFLFWEYLFQIFGISSLQCGPLQIYQSAVIFSSQPVNYFFIYYIKGKKLLKINKEDKEDGHYSLVQ
jgi:hypothetical protein